MDKTAKKRRPSFRHWVQAGWTAATNGYIYGYINGRIYTGRLKQLCVPGLNCYSCPGAFGSCPIGSLQATLDSGNYKIAFYVFGFLMFFGSLFGRFVCGWLCPFGFVQDMVHKIPLFKKEKNMPGHKVLKYLKYVILAIFVILLPSVIRNDAGIGSPWFCEYICPSGTLLGGIPLTLLNSSLAEAIGLRYWWKVGLLVIILILSIKYFRPFCKYICPLGAIYSLFNPISLYRLKVDGDKCVSCGACANACKMGVEPFKTPNSPECIRCGDCIRSCPKGAIERISFKKEIAAEEAEITQ